jgi:5-methylcytosine-specific restriction endonuclease McrA
MTIDPTSDDYLAPRRCMRQPIPAIYEAARLLSEAVDAHLAGDRATAADLIAQADLPKVREWTESLWGSAIRNPATLHHHRYRDMPGAAAKLCKAERQPMRNPSEVEKQELLKHWGFNCAFCGIPVIRTEVRSALVHAYPELNLWGRSNATQHAGLQCLWVQYDHVVPHSRGGDSSVGNVIITCAPCNYGRNDRLPEELGLIDPRSRPVARTEWDGLERLLGKKALRF